MRFVILFAAACALGCVAEAAVAPELGYAKLLTGEKGLKFCDGTVCSKGCCPEPGFDCCSDGSHCANNVANCPYCPKGEDGAGGWCKENVDEHGELTEDDPCCDKDIPQYCVHDDDTFAGTCGGPNDFCDDTTDLKCGHNCCDDTIEVCCPDNQCVPFNGAGVADGTECDYYCRGEVCGPEPNAINGLDPDTNPDDAQACCLPPYKCCQDGTATCSEDGTGCDDPVPPTLLCGSNPNTAYDCKDAADNDGTTVEYVCCPNDLPGCYDTYIEDDMYAQCPGTVCGDGNYCVGPKPYCCNDKEPKECVAHLDDCFTCTIGANSPECIEEDFRYPICCDDESTCVADEDDCVAPPFTCTPGATSTECTDVDIAKPYCCDGGAVCAENAQLCTPPECTAGPSSSECTDPIKGYCCPDESTCVANAQSCTCAAGPSSPGCISGSDHFCCADGKTCAADVTGCACTGTGATSQECNDGTDNMYCCASGFCDDNINGDNC